MTRNWIGRLLAISLLTMPFVAAAQTSDDAPMMDDTAMSGPLSPTAMKAMIWTDKLGYSTGEQMNVYLTLDPMGDTNAYTCFVYRENIETGERQYLPLTAGGTLTDDVVDSAGQTVDNAMAAAVTARDQALIWSGSVPAPGLWQWVGELRGADATQVVKKIYGKFVVSQQSRVELGFDGTDTEISTDTTWTNDTIYRLRHQVFVNDGATLTIEPGTLIQASGQNAVIVVEKGGKIMAEGTREAPIVMTCDQSVGQRESGCWAGLIILGNAPMTRGTGLAEGVIPETRPTYGGDDPMDSSGVLRYVRVEFAGVDFNPETQPNGFGFHGVGSGTVIDHIQAHEGEDDGIEFFGGNADCMYCVSSGSKDDSLDWAFGWQGTAQYVFIQQDPLADNGIEADNDSQGFDRTPRSHPQLYNVTLVGGLAQDENSSSGDGMRIRVGSAITARNVLLTGFGGDALDVRDNSPSLFMDGTSSIKNAIIHSNGGETGADQIAGGVASSVEYMDVDPMLVNVRYEANPDPRPMLGSPALLIGNAATPPGTGSLDTSAQFIGAFGDENWLEEWTFFGDEFDYDTSE
ncbi:MAG: hypothetical protein OXN96_06275 [Bryobacterales bacterium]|nr:hypothetical protein [Bryobacterales bacterium]MDE0620329.1 hypothetical protein [Bryobacterales bacterium]